MNLRIKNYFLASIYYLIGFVLFGLVILPSIKIILDANEQMNSDTVTLEALTAKVTALNSIDEAKSRSDLNEMLTSLPSDKSVPGLLSGLQRLATIASASVSTYEIDPGKISSESGTQSTASAKQVQNSITNIASLANNVTAVSFDVKISGSLQSIRDFIYNLHRSKRLIGINKFDYLNGDCSFLLEVYYQPLDSSLGEITRPIDSLTAKESASLKTVEGYTSGTTGLEMLPAGRTNLFN